MLPIGGHALSARTCSVVPLTEPPGKCTASTRRGGSESVTVESKRWEEDSREAARVVSHHNPRYIKLGAWICDLY